MTSRMNEYSYPQALIAFFSYKFIDNNYEEGLASWLFQQIRHFREDGVSEEPQLQDNVPSVNKLADELAPRRRSTSTVARFVQRICPAFVNYLGITHYISAIKLGACQYRLVTSRSEDKHTVLVQLWP